MLTQAQTTCLTAPTNHVLRILAKTLPRAVGTRHRAWRASLMRCSGTSCAARDTETTKLKPQQIPPLAPRRSLLLAISTGKQQVGLLRLLLLLLLLLLIETNKNCCHRPVPALPIVASGNGCSVEFKVESLPPIPDASYISSSSSVKFHANQQQTKKSGQTGSSQNGSPRRAALCRPLCGATLRMLE